MNLNLMIAFDVLRLKDTKYDNSAKTINNTELSDALAELMEIFGWSPTETYTEHVLENEEIEDETTPILLCLDEDTINRDVDFDLTPYLETILHDLNIVYKYDAGFCKIYLSFEDEKYCNDRKKFEFLFKILYNYKFNTIFERDIKTITINLLDLNEFKILKKELTSIRNLVNDIYNLLFSNITYFMSLYNNNYQFKKTFKLSSLYFYLTLNYIKALELDYIIIISRDKMIRYNTRSLYKHLDSDYNLNNYVIRRIVPEISKPSTTVSKLHIYDLLGCYINGKELTKKDLYYKETIDILKPYLTEDEVLSSNIICLCYDNIVTLIADLKNHFHEFELANYVWKLVISQLLGDLAFSFTDEDERQGNFFASLINNGIIDKKIKLLISLQSKKSVDPFLFGNLINDPHMKTKTIIKEIYGIK